MHGTCMLCIFAFINSFLLYFAQQSLIIWKDNVFVHSSADGHSNCLQCGVTMREEKKRASIDTVSKLYVNMFSRPLRKYKENKGSVVWWLYVLLCRKVSTHVLEHLPHSAFSPVIQESLSCSVPRRYLMWWGFGQLSSIQWINSDLPSLLAFVFWNWHLALRGE